jgi:exodeoxyribonuclease VII large subunit
MIKRLQAQGLFDEKHKKPLPVYPERIGIVTSESGAAVHDIVDSIHNRWPCVRLFLYPVAVQGEGAAHEIASALRDVNRRNDRLKLNVLIVGRGGGSLEDLWAFNEEVVARAIFDSQIPVISAVGHEVDTTIADLVADARASTPTKAGVVAVPDMYEVLGNLANKESRLMGIIRGRLDLARQNLRTIQASSVFRNPLLAVRDRQQQLDEANTRLAELTRVVVGRARTMLQASYEQIARIEPHRLIAKVTVGLNNLQNRAAAAANATLNKCRLQLTAKENLLAGLNPKSVLHRGYSITTRKKTGLLVRNSTDVQIGDRLVTELAEENLIESKVTRK